jgi:stage V sporulation protein B
MGLITFLAYRLFRVVHLGHIATILALIVAVLVYAIALLSLGGLSRSELLMMPGGVRVVKILDRFHFLSARLDRFN